MAKVPVDLQESWISAFRQENGHELMELLGKEARLLTVKYCGCTVLHLAIRKRWYGLVKQILETLDLYKDESSGNQASSSGSETANPVNPSSATFKELLEAKEGSGESSSSANAEWIYSSGLDALAMAVIQGHGEINWILAQAVSMVGDTSYHGHPYKDIICRRKRERLDWSARPEKEILCEIIEIAFRLERTKTPLEDKMGDTWKKTWKLTSPFRPFEEFVFLSCFLHPSPWLGDSNPNENVRRMKNNVLAACRRKNAEAPFMEYLLAIDDTWGKAIHHAVRAKDLNLDDPRNAIQALLDMIPHENKNYVNSFDGAGRRPIHTALALGRLEEVRELLRHSRKRRVDILSVKRREGESNAEVELESLTQRKSGNWEIVEKIVSEKNGYSPDAMLNKETPSAFALVARSPHLTQDERRDVTEVLLVETRDKYVNDPFECLQDTKPCWKTPLQFAAYIGDAATLQVLAKEDWVYDSARRNNLSRKPSGKSWPSGLHIDSALHDAATGAHPHAIGIILTTGKFDPSAKDENQRTALHLATRFEYAQYPHSLAEFYEIPCERKGILFLSAEEQREQREHMEGRRKSCIDLLLLAGMDIFALNKQYEIANPGPKASREYHTWWIERLSKKTLEIKTHLHAAANVLSVMATVVIAATFQGPHFQPSSPESFAHSILDKFKLGGASLIFKCCNLFAFVSAFAVLMMSVYPLLSTRAHLVSEDVELVRWIVQRSSLLLLLSLNLTLAAFVSATLAAVPAEWSWDAEHILPGCIFIFWLVIYVPVMFFRSEHLLKAFFLEIKEIFRPSRRVSRPLTSDLSLKQ